MPSPRYIVDKQVPVELIPYLKQDHKNKKKASLFPETTPKMTKKTAAKNENNVIGGMKGQAKIGSFLIKSPPKSKTLTKPQSSNLISDHSSKRKGSETDSNKTENENRAKFVGDNKTLIFKTNSILELREEPTQIIAEDDTEVSDVQTSEAKSACTPNPCRKRNTASISLIQDFESSAETPVIKKANFSHESTWMTPISIANEKEDSIRITQSGSSKQTPLPLQTPSSNEENSKPDTAAYPNKTISHLTSPSQTSSTKLNIASVMTLTSNTPQLSSHRKNLKKHYESLKDQLINYALGACIEENFTNLDPIPDPQSSITYEDGIFPNELETHLAVAIQGR